VASCQAYSTVATGGRLCRHRGGIGVLTTTLQFSTDKIRPAERLRTWYGVFDRSVTRRTLTPLSDGPLDMCVKVSQTPPGTNASPATNAEVHVQRMSFGAGFSAQRTADLVSDGNDDVVLYIHRTGRRIVSQFGRETEVAAGSGIAISNGSPSSIVVPEASRFACIAVPRKVLLPLVPNLENTLVRPLSGDSGVLRLLDSYLAALEDGALVNGPELRQPVVTHVYDLIAVVLGAARDCLEIASGRGIRAARLLAIKADIARHLTTGEVTAGALAVRHHVTPRYIHKLFEGEGTTLSQYVLGQRLSRVHRMLADARHGDRTIGALAFSAGFGDLSTFNHAFRRHFGATPSEIRSAATGEVREKCGGGTPSCRNVELAA
jgi:AraC-like DNA-binding protein